MAAIIFVFYAYLVFSIYDKIITALTFEKGEGYMDISALHDFHPYDTGLELPVKDLLASYQGQGAAERGMCGRDAFIALLAGVAALRRTPGIPGPGEAGEEYFTTLPICAEEESREACRAHLEKIFGITDKDSMLDFCRQEILCHSQYLDFEGFWEGRPPFSMYQLQDGAREFFTVARDFSAQFYEIVGHRGYLAWDISECVGHLRAGFACGLISRRELDDLAEHWITQAQIFGSWPEYAASLVCGQMYWDFRHGTKLPQLQEGQKLWMRLVHTLLEDNRAWGSDLWYVPPRRKEFLLWPPQLKKYLTHWDGPAGCFVTDEITIAGRKVGWCYREQPDGELPDSGWRFFAGDESESYIDDPSHTEVCELNTVCNYDPDILPLLDAPYGSAFARGEDGQFEPAGFPVRTD